MGSGAFTVDLASVLHDVNSYRQLQLGYFVTDTVDGGETRVAEVHPRLVALGTATSFADFDQVIRRCNVQVRKRVVLDGFKKATS